MTHRIITRGLGTKNLLATRGYGRRTVIIEAEPKRRPGGRGPARKKRIALDEEQCFRINVVLEAINDDNIDDIEGCVEKCYNEKDKLSVSVKNLNTKIITVPPDPVKVEALLLWIKKKKR